MTLVGLPVYFCLVTTLVFVFILYQYLHDEYRYMGNACFGRYTCIRGLLWHPVVDR